MNSKRTVQEFYRYILDWVLEVYQKSDLHDRPIIVGVNGPQGCGKSTLVGSLVDLLSAKRMRGVALSIDDFYLTRQEQIQLAEKYASNPLLQQRGYPGTHDVSLGTQILKSLKNVSDFGSVICPVYDKSQWGGLGDRYPQAQWKEVKAPVDIIFLEGWMLGFVPTEREKLPNSSFEEVNSFLKQYQEWYSLLHGFIQLIPKEISYVLRWRVQAEAKMKEQGKSGMSPQEVENYVKKFIPAYEVYLPILIENPPLKKNVLQLTLAEDRLPN